MDGGIIWNNQHCYVMINSLAAGKCKSNFEIIISLLIIQNNNLDTWCKPHCLEVNSGSSNGLVPSQVMA